MVVRQFLVTEVKLFVSGITDPVNMTPKRPGKRATERPRRPHGTRRRTGSAAALRATPLKRPKGSIERSERPGRPTIPS